MDNFPIIAAILVAFGVTFILGYWLIPLMKKVKFGQTILDIGPRWHKNKQGTPTMGGIMFSIGITAAVIIGMIILLMGVTNNGNIYFIDNRNVAMVTIGLLVSVGFGFIGFLDDYIKVVKKRNLGLTEKQKLIMQVAVAGFYILFVHLMGYDSTIIDIPFLFQINLGILYYPIAILGIVFMVNVVNFNDGIDGLCSAVTFIAAIGCLIISGILNNSGMGIMSGALAGGALGFLVWNLNPAKIFMGDTGSMFLGGMVVAVVFGLGIPAFIILLGMVYILEGLSVVIQTIYFKYTRKKYGEGRRIFKMSPIHHHFEMCGWSENKIVVSFSFIQLIFTILAVLAALKL